MGFAHGSIHVSLLPFPFSIMTETTGSITVVNRGPPVIGVGLDDVQQPSSFGQFLQPLLSFPSSVTTETAGSATVVNRGRPMVGFGLDDAEQPSSFGPIPTTPKTQVKTNNTEVACIYSHPSGFGVHMDQSTFLFFVSHFQL